MTVATPGEIETYIRWALSGERGNMKSVYLAGPIAGCDQAEANDWRHTVQAKLRSHGINGISPLRCEPLIGDRYMLNYADPKFGTARAIGSKNIFDVRHCDMTLAYLPREINERRLSYGTIIELAWAHMIGKPTILVTDDPAVREHPVVNVCAGWLLGTLDEAAEVLVGVLGDYAHKAATPLRREATWRDGVEDALATVRNCRSTIDDSIYAQGAARTVQADMIRHVTELLGGGPHRDR